jgi:hypothetical protein
LINSREISADFLLWVEAYYHFRNGEDDQSFLMNWFVIERHLYPLLERHLTELANKDSISKDKKEKLGKLSVASLLLFLRATECIDKNHYNILAELNDSRNDLVHGGVPISRRISKKCLEYSEGTIKKLT